MPGATGNKAAGDGDFNNKHSKGGAGTNHGAHGHMAKSPKLGTPKGNPGHHGKMGKKGY